MSDCQCSCDVMEGNCCFPNCLPEEDQQALANEVYRQLYSGEPAPRKSVYAVLTEIILGVIIAALGAILVATYVFFVGFGIQCNGRGGAEFHAPLMYDCWFERSKK